MQRRDSRLRVNVQLIDAETGTHLWADRFDKPVSDLFDMQDEIVSLLANALNAQLIEAEAHRAQHAVHPDATDLAFQGFSWSYKGPPLSTWLKRACFSRVPWKSIPEVSERWSAWHASIWRWVPPC